MGGGTATGIMPQSEEQIRLEDTVYYVTHASKGKGFRRLGFTTYSLVELPRVVAEQVKEIDRRLANIEHLWWLFYGGTINTLENQKGWFIETDPLAMRFSYYSESSEKRGILSHFGPTRYAITRWSPIRQNSIVEKDTAITTMSGEDLANLKSASRREFGEAASKALKLKS